jgi:spermidine synthase
VSHLAIYLLFFLSGISGLVYQVVWVREFGHVFGNTVHSASIVTAVFMGGLGVGSLVVGRYSDRRHAGDPDAALRLYGLFELGIATLGLAVALVLPRLEGISPAFSSYTPGPEGWLELTAASYAARYLGALVLLLPITLLMGGTLTLLIRRVVAGALPEAGLRVGILYGLNTAGAALGAFATDFALVPGLGIFRAELIAVGLNVVAGLGAVALAGRPGTRRNAAVVEPESPDLRGIAQDPRVLGTIATLFVAGFVAMGLEIVWFRYLTSGLGAFRATFSLLMTVILVGIFVGSILGGWLERRTRRPVALFLCAQALLILLALLPMAALGESVFVLFDREALLALASPGHRSWAEIAVSLPSIVAVVGPSALAMGCSFPLCNAHVQRVEAAVGGRAGALYLANTLGNVAGSLTTAFVLLPWLGQQDSVALLVLFAAVGLVPLYRTARTTSMGSERVPRAIFVGCLSALLLGFGAWQLLPGHHLLRYARTPGFARVIEISEGINETALVLEQHGGRALYTDGHPMSANDESARRYMRLFSHMPLLNHEDPRSVLVICFGVGNTLHAASLHESVERLDVVDLSKNVLGLAHYFEAGNHDVLEDERVSVYVNDGRQHLRMMPPETYDLITLEPPPIAHAGVASLYSSEFYALARSRLQPGGYMTQWLPIYQVDAPVARSMIRSFIDVFPNATLLSGAGRELILIGRADAELHFDPERVKRKLEANPRVRDDLERIHAASLTELVATFVAGPITLDRATSGVPPVTDDRPILEYARGITHVRTRLPEEVFDAWEMRSWCPRCYVDGRPLPELAELPELMRALSEYYATDAFLEYSNYLPPRELSPLASAPCRLDVVRNNPYLRRTFRCLGRAA